MKSRILVAVVGIPLLVWVVLWAPEAVMAVALCVLAGIGGMELQKCVSAGMSGAGRRDSGILVLSTLYPVCTVLGFWLCPGQMAVLFILGVALLFGYAIVRAGAVRFEQLMAVLFSGVFIGYSFSAFLRLLSGGVHRAYLLLPFLLSFACDTFAYFAGRAFGKHKLAPKVSPKKTVEGSIGGILGNIVCGLLFALVMDRFFSAGIAYAAMALLAFLCSIVAQIGDLSFSLIKRQYGIKDYGHLFLEHGGVLDRFDSVLFVTPVIEAVLQLLSVV